MLARINENFKRDLYFDGDFDATNSGDLRQSDGLSNLRQAMLNRLLTIPGTIPHRPNYGVGITSFKGIVNSIENQIELMHRLQEQFEDEERIAEILGLSFTPNENNPSEVTMRLTVRPVGQEAQLMDFDISQDV